MKTLKTGDTVKVIAGDNKGETAKIVRMKDGKAFLEGIGLKERHFKRSMFRPQGGKAEIHVGIDPSNLRLVKAAEPKKAAKKAKTTEKSAKGEQK